MRAPDLRRQIPGQHLSWDAGSAVRPDPVRLRRCVAQRPTADAAAGVQLGEASSCGGHVSRDRSGHPLHGEPSLDQLYAMRPILGWAQYRTPIEHLYLCGAGTHPGGGITGAPGRNAAREIIKALK